MSAPAHWASQQAGELADSVGRALGLDVRSVVLRFLHCLAVDCAENAPLSTIVSDTGSPFEFSFSSRREPACLRMLGEAAEPGEPILSRCLRGIEGALNVASAFGLGGKRGHVAEALEVLMPPGEYLAQLQWAAAVWLALRADGVRNHCRVYVNLQWRPDNGPRFARVAECLSVLGAADAQAHLGVVIPLLSGWSSLVGMSLDLLPGQIRPARLHLDPGRLPARRLATLLRHCGADEWREDVFRFLDLFDPLPAEGPKPFLLSTGLGAPEARSLKLDANLRAMPRLTGAWAWELLEGAEAIAGRVEEYHRVKRLFARQGDERGMQYLGLTVGNRVQPYLNVYLAPPSRQPRERSHEQTPTAPPGRGTRSGRRAQAGVDFLISAAAHGGGFLMDARGKSSERRRIPQDWCDIYVTALVSQEARLLRAALPVSFTDMLAGFIADAGIDGVWRYLPGLPPDADDTAMALSSLLEAGRAVPEAWLRRLLETRSADGGFVTFFGSADQFAHPAVTLNVVRALDLGNVAWDTRPTQGYLLRWINDPAFPACIWSHSPLLPLFLLARTTAVHRWLGEMAREAIARRVSVLRRPDGLWGRANPEVLETALAVQCHAALGLELKPAAEVLSFLTSCQLPDGGWGWSPLYSDGCGTWFGHRAASTVLAMRAVDTLKTLL